MAQQKKGLADLQQNFSKTRQEYRGTIIEGSQDPESRGSGEKYLIDIGGELLAIAESGPTAKELCWMDLAPYSDCEVKITGIRKGEIIHDAHVTLTRLPNQQFIETVTVFNASEQLSITSKPSKEFAATGTISRQGGGIFTKGKEAIILGLDGGVNVPSHFRFTLHSGLTDPKNAMFEKYAPTLRGLSNFLPPLPIEVKTVPDMMALIRYATYARDKDFFFGAYPKEDPHVLSYLNRVAEARIHHQIVGHKQRLRKLGDVILRDEWDKIGNWVAESISTSGDSRNQRDNLWQGSREAVKANIPKLVTLARNVKAYQFRHDAQRKITADTIQDLRQEVEDELWDVANVQPYFDGVKSLFVPMLGISLSAIVGLGAITAFTVCDSPQKSQVALAGLFGVVMLSSLSGIAGSEVSSSQARERARNTHKLQRKLTEIQHLEDMQADLERERVSHEAVGEILSIMSETREDLHNELQLLGPEDEDRKRWAHKKARAHFDRRLDELRHSRDSKDSADKFATALIGKDPQTCARIIVRHCSRANELFQPAKASSTERVTMLMNGFASLTLSDTASESDTMWR